MSASFWLCLYLLVTLSYHIINVLSCDPTIYYPSISNLQRLSSSENEIIITLKEEENGDEFCVIFDLNENTFADTTVECSSYSNDILEFTSDNDITSTTINSIDESLGISITRNSNTFSIGWDQLKNISNITASSYSLSDIESFTINQDSNAIFMTFLKISDELFAIDFNSGADNQYILYSAYSSIDFNLLTTKSYSDYKLLSFIDESDDCNENVLYIYDIIYIIDDNQYLLNLTYIESEWNIDFDERNGFAYFWGYSPTFRSYDAELDGIYLHRFGAVDYSDITNNINNNNSNRAFLYNVHQIYVLSSFIVIYLFNMQ